jgi:hypothetical protein
VATGRFFSDAFSLLGDFEHNAIFVVVGAPFRLTFTSVSATFNCTIAFMAGVMRLVGLIRGFHRASFGRFVDEFLFNFKDTPPALLEALLLRGSVRIHRFVVCKGLETQFSVDGVVFGIRFYGTSFGGSYKTLEDFYRDFST